MEQDLYLHGLIKAVPVETPAWTRPEDWLVVPDLLPEDDKIYLLLSIEESTTANYVAFICTGNYTVDWGDGVIQNIASGVKAQHQYDWNAISADTLTSEGYRQIIATITPNGGSLLTANFATAPSAVFGNTYFMTPILEAKVNCPAMTLLILNESYNFTSNTAAFWILKHVVLGENNISNMDGLFEFSGVECVEITGNLDHVTNCASMFYSCQNLRKVILPDIINCTNFSNMFNFCPNLREVNSFLTTSGTNFNNMFRTCYSIEGPITIHAPAATTFSNAFRDCYALQSIILTGLSNVTTLGAVCMECYNLLDLQISGTSPALLDVNYMIYNCMKLQELPIMNTSNVTDFSSAFRQAYNLRSIPAYDIGNATETTSTFPYQSLTSINVTNITQNISVENNLLDRVALVAIFNNLQVAVAKTITITNNPGVPNLTAGDLLIATSKGWSVVT